MCRMRLAALVLSSLMCASGAGASQSARVAVLDFELNDLTLSPAQPEELERTRSIKPLLQQALGSGQGYRIVAVEAEAQQQADAGFGYLFDRDEVAAQLGRDYGADWVVVGRVHKASFLFVYFMAHVIDTRTAERVGNLVVEVKGPQQKLTVRGVESLAEQIDGTIQARGAVRP